MPTFTDAIQRPIQINEPPKRIVSLVPSITETLFAFGAGNTVAGVTNFCVEPRGYVEGKPKVGGTKTLDIARVKSLEPDLVIANAEENRQEDVRQLIAGGLTVFITFPRTITHAIAMMRQISEMTGTETAAHPYLEDAEVTLAQTRVANTRRRPLRVFCPIWRSPWMTIGPGTYMHDFIAHCGGVNIYSHRHERYPRTELNEIARRNPEVILLPDEPYHFGEKHIPELSRYEYVSAVQNQRIYLLEGKHLCWYGPRIAGSLRYVQSLLWGEQKDVDETDREVVSV